MEIFALDSEMVLEYIKAFMLVFTSSFMITVALHYVSYGIFKVFHLINIK